MKTITATVPAWITDSRITLAHLSQMTEAEAISALHFYESPSGTDMANVGWVRAGNAEVTVIFHNDAKIIGKQIGIMRAAQQKVRADCEVALNQLEGQIQSLLAIESKP